jgi:hypothetical protein
MKILRALGLSGAALIFLTGTTFAPREFPAGVQDAPQIVRGKVGTTYSDWGRSSDGARRLYTFYELQIEEVFKGQISGRSLTMREFGGQKDGVGMEVPGAAKFQPGEDVVVFLSNKNSEGTHDLRGLMMGKYGIQRDADGKEFLTGPGITGLTAHSPTQSDEDAHPHPQGQGQDGGAPKKWTLDALRQLIATQAQSPTDTGANASPSPTAPSTPSATATSEAPRLQSHYPQEQPEDSSSEAASDGGRPTAKSLGLAAIIALLLGIAAYVVIFRKRS